MKKLHLPAVVPNEGARLLARRIQAAYRGDLPFASRCMKIAMRDLQMMVDGTLVPGEELVRDVARATAHGIGRSDWRSRPVGGWFDAERIAA
ncbi:hypothetical protein [Sphingomonas sp. RIT328]|uniref:hypothetical protein n=1 Tax=Sphingomonas sp. RIT328 TaxID=1470591 RepID=UPI000446D166|nr:hypothetical protein [Sphingomonas sp. RIT328]EZP57241.1 hypothetical protein BW41_00084 [Sphingomonas sp. RIT328]